MTRLLSELLGAKEPDFRLGLVSLERANGMPSADIRLSTETSQAARNKLKQLALDPDDTTGLELYHSLQERIKDDDTILEKILRTAAATHISALGNVMDGMVYCLRELPIDKTCFALKTSVLKSLLAKHVPRQTMKQLGYRSQSSMLKHETAINLLAGAWLVESDSWRRGLIAQYEKLKPKDFETRPIHVSTPSGKRWDQLVTKVVAEKRHNVISFSELGAIVLLPLPELRPKGSVTAAIALALNSYNEIRACSTFLKLCQVRSDFGHIVSSVALHEPLLNTRVLDQLIPWRLLQRYYAGAESRFNEALFEPHIQLSDLSWHSIEHLLSLVAPNFEFWHGTAHLGVIHNRQPVSLNVIDTALNYCNQLPYANRIVHFAQSSLWEELMLRYLKHTSVEQTIASQLQPDLAMEQALI